MGKGCLVATRDVFSEEELAQLRGFPEAGRGDLIRYFTLTAAEETFVRKFRGPGSVLGAAIQLCTLPWLGFGPRGTTERKVPARSDRCGQYRCSGRSTGRDRCLALVPPGISRMNMSAAIHLVTCRNSR
jgi:Domain of unknown function (DUF4158)